MCVTEKSALISLLTILRVGHIWIYFKTDYCLD
jgi:hypothetical protein